MKDIYKKLWEKAKPYYLEGRPMDVDHIEWMMGDAMLLCDREGIDDTLLLPVVILHDVGYAKVPKDDPFNLDLREAHMREGALIAEEILSDLNYPEDQTKKIVYYISVHDNWAYGGENNELYKNDIILGSFNDLDYMWMATPKGFPALMKIKDFDAKEMYDYLLNDEKPKLRPFSTKTTLKLYEDYLKARRDEYSL